MINILKFRKKINILDKKLLVLLKKRIQVCEELAYFKKKSGLKLTDKNRESEIVIRLRKELKNYFSKKEITNFVETILNISKQRMKKITKKSRSL
jgi:chorismate mutase/prephenate dehydratase